MPEKEWSFCRRCSWHSAGRVAQCPKCGNENVNVVDNGPLLEEKGSDFYPSKEEAG
jgi:hypothetical protein